MSTPISLRDLPQHNLFRAGDVFVLFGELFGRGYANGLVNEARKAGMTIVGITVGRRDEANALRPLNELLSIEEPPRANGENEHAVLVVRLGSENIGLLVDDFHGTSDIILKPLEGVLAGITGFAGTALMGDGSVLMILNPKELF